MGLNPVDTLGEGLLEGGAIVTSSDRIDGGSASGHGSRRGEESESQGGEDGYDERTHCE